jgi:hypothetical protein
VSIEIFSQLEETGRKEGRKKASQKGKKECRGADCY